MKITPNMITTVRIILLPFIAFFYLADFIPWGKFIAVILFIIAAVTDFVDGKLARKTGQVTDLGKLLDTIADKFLVSLAIILVACDGTIPAPFGAICAIIIICREFAVTFLRQVAVNKGFVMNPDKLGKYKATLQMVAIPALMVLAFLTQYGYFAGTILDVFAIVCYVLIGLATLLTIISGINYFVKNRKLFKE